MPLFRQLEKGGLWNGAYRHIVRLNPVLERVAERGMPVNQEAFDEVVKRLRGDYQAEKAKMQSLIPDELKNKKVYKKTPKVRLEECVYVDGAWTRMLPWSPSNKSLCAYIRFKGLKVPKNLKTEKDTTAAIEIARLARKTKDPLYATVIAYRKAQTVLTNHVKNWKPGPDQRVHTSFYYDPATGQLSSRRPNVQNAPRHDDPEFGGYAKVFRSMIKARDGFTLIEADFKSFHAQTLAFEAEDKDYLRLAKLDIHSFLAAHLVHDPKAGIALTWVDDELREYLKWIKKTHEFVRDYKAKRAILGYGFGLGARKLYDMNKESFDGQKDAKRTLDMLDATFPVTKKWRETIRHKANDQGYLISRHGYIRYFWEVFRERSDGWMPGDDSEAAVAFLPANDAFGEIKDRMLTLAKRELDEKYGLINTIHDSLMFECPDIYLDEAIPTIRAIMQFPSKVLISQKVAPLGLSVEVDIKAGRDWATMRGVA